MWRPRTAAGLTIVDACTAGVRLGRVVKYTKRMSAPVGGATVNVTVHDAASGADGRRRLRVVDALGLQDAVDDHAEHAA
jgi:hypothetical protein